MKTTSTRFLQVVIVLCGLAVLSFLLWEPHLEGRNANASVFDIYFKDPLLAYVYIASIPFFIALYQAIKLLGYVGKDAAFTPSAVAALRTIKLCAISIVGFVVVSVAFMPFTDPEPPGVVMRIIVVLGSIVVATAAATFEKVFHNATSLKSENDLTV